MSEDETFEKSLVFLYFSWRHRVRHVKYKCNSTLGSAMFKNSLFFVILKMKNEIRKCKSMEMLNEIDVFWGDSDLYMEKTIQSRKRREKENRISPGPSEVYRENLEVLMKMIGFT